MCDLESILTLPKEQQWGGCLPDTSGNIITATAATTTTTVATVVIVVIITGIIMFFRLRQSLCRVQIPVWQKGC